MTLRFGLLLTLTWGWGCADRADPPTPLTPVPPVAVLSVAPADRAQDVPIETRIEIELTRPGEVEVQLTLAGERVEATQATVGTTVTLTPDVSLRPGEIYAINVDTEPPFSSSFSTRAPTLQERLEGRWRMTGQTCAGEVQIEPFDVDEVEVEFAERSAAITLENTGCFVGLPFELTYDDASGSLVGEPSGSITCAPAGCGPEDVCEVEASTLISRFVATATLTDELVLTTGDPSAFPADMCGAPAVQMFEKVVGPLVIDETVCDPIDPYAPHRTVYYVAAEEPGADNDRCDGLAPTDEGNGRCPFRDFSSEAVRNRLIRVHAVTVAVRTGTYVVEPINPMPNDPSIGLRIESLALHREDAVIFTTYQNEEVTLDGTCPETMLGCDSPEDPGRIWNLLALFGRHIQVLGFTFDNVHKWNLTVGSERTCVMGNRFVGSYGSDSDSLKAFGGSGPHVVVRANEFTAGFEQAIDATGAWGWIIEDNSIHDAPDRGVGFKFGAKDVIVRNNVFSNLPGNAISLGGTSSSHFYPQEAQRLVAHDNRAINVGGLAEMYSCVNCRLEDNTVEGGAYGVIFYDDAEPSGCSGGCPISREVSLQGNRFRALNGGDDTPPNAFIIMAGATVEDFEAGQNLYCTEPSGTALFGLNGDPVGFEEWRDRTMADATSSVQARSSPDCSAPW